MKIIYLWIKDFRGFKNQGFNFSSEFDIDFKYIDNKNFEFKKFNKIDISENSYFPRNINISLLVGKNGSGKSTILEIIKYGINEFFSKDNSDLYFVLFFDKDENKIILKGNFEGYKLEDNQSKIIDKIDEKLLKSKIDNEVKKYNHAVIEKIQSKKIYNIYYTKTIKSYPDTQSNISEHLLNISDEYLYEKYVEDIQQQYKSTLRDFFQIKTLYNDNLVQNGLLAFYKDNFSFPNDWQKPIKLSVVFKHNYIFDSYKDMLNKLDENREILKNLFSIIKVHDKNGTPLLDRIDWIYFIKYLAILNFITQNNQGISSSIHYNIFKDIPYSSNKDYKKNIDEIIQYFMQEFQIENSSYTISREYFQKVSHIIEKLEHFNDFYNNKQFLININSNIDELLDIIELHKSITSVVSGFLGFRLYPIMSDGHQEFFNLFAKLYMAINTSFENKKPKKEDTILLLLDEPDNFLHPEWQREFIDILTNFLSSNYSNYDFHIFIATHSPIMLSDMPKQNIIFLKDFKIQQFDGNTLGANIHHILKDGFFLKDTMGEYINKHIKDFIKLYYKDKMGDDISMELGDKKELFKFIIDNIGETYIKNVLSNHFDELENKYPEVFI